MVGIKNHYNFIIIKIKNEKSKISIFILQSIAKSKVWIKLESFYGEKFPLCVKQLLIATGYDKFMNLSKLDEEKIIKIEQHINQNRSLLESLNCCNMDIYKNQTEFAFLPGHKTIILEIPTQISRMKESQSGANKKPLKSTNKSENELKQELVKSLSNYYAKLSLPSPTVVISFRSINDFICDEQNEKKIYKCNFSCPFCSKVVPITYKNFWMTSNATKHLKSHASGEMIPNSTEYIIEVADENALDLSSVQ